MKVSPHGKGGEISRGQRALYMFAGYYLLDGYGDLDEVFDLEGLMLGGAGAGKKG